MTIYSGRQSFTTDSHPHHILSNYLNFQQEAYGLLKPVSVLVGTNAKVNNQKVKMLKLGMKLHLKVHMTNLNF